MQQISGLHRGCIDGHEMTLNSLVDFKTTFEQSDLLVSFVDKSDLDKVQRERRRALDQIHKLNTKLKNSQMQLVSKYIANFSLYYSCMTQDSTEEKTSSSAGKRH